MDKEIILLIEGHIRDYQLKYALVKINSKKTYFINTFCINI